MRNKTTYYIGIILIILGGAALYNSIFLEDLFSMRNMWPLFILLPGLFLQIDYFSNYRYRDPSVLIPGGLLTLIGGFYLLKEFVPIMDRLTAPIFMVILGLALLQYYVAKPKDRGLLMISITLILTGTFVAYGRYIGDFPDWLTFSTLRAFVILLFGIYLVFRTSTRPKKPDSTYRVHVDFEKEPKGKTKKHAEEAYEVYEHPKNAEGEDTQKP